MGNRAKRRLGKRCWHRKKSSGMGPQQNRDMSCLPPVGSNSVMSNPGLFAGILAKLSMKAKLRKGE